MSADTELKKDTFELVKRALGEDIGRGDLTSLACLEPFPLKAKVLAKSEGVLSGVEPFMMAFEIVDSANVVGFIKKDGDSFKSGEAIATIDGFNQTVLTTERVALNFLSHLSGVATLTNKFVHKIKEAGNKKCKIIDTRKTTPGMRLLEKAAVAHGGGLNHRMGLYDMVLIKDNHIAASGSVKKAVELMREYLSSPEFRLQFDKKAGDIEIEIEIEITNEQELREAIDCGIKRILLDNQSVDSLKTLVALAKKLNPKIKTEASGGVNLENVAEIAATGVDYISIGALTHSAPAVDFSLEIIES